MEPSEHWVRKMERRRCFWRCEHVGRRSSVPPWMFSASVGKCYPFRTAGSPFLWQELISQPPSHHKGSSRLLPGPTASTLKDLLEMQNMTAHPITNSWESFLWRLIHPLGDSLACQSLVTSGSVSRMNNIQSFSLTCESPVFLMSHRDCTNALALTFGWPLELLASF